MDNPPKVGQKLAADEYAGVLKVLTRSQLKVHLRAMLDRARDQAKKTADESFARGVRDIDGLVDGLGLGKTITRSVWQLGDDDKPNCLHEV